MNVIMWPDDMETCMACGVVLIGAHTPAVEVYEWVPMEQRNVMRGAACPEHLVQALIKHLQPLPAL